MALIAPPYNVARDIFPPTPCKFDCLIAGVAESSYISPRRIRKLTIRRPDATRFEPNVPKSLPSGLQPCTDTMLINIPFLHAGGEKPPIGARLPLRGVSVIGGC